MFLLQTGPKISSSVPTPQKQTRPFRPLHSATQASSSSRPFRPLHSGTQAAPSKPSPAPVVQPQSEPIAPKQSLEEKPIFKPLTSAPNKQKLNTFEGSVLARELSTTSPEVSEISPNILRTILSEIFSYNNQLSNSDIVPFKFDTPSPDDDVLTARKQAVKPKKRTATILFIYSTQ